MALILLQCDRYLQLRRLLLCNYTLFPALCTTRLYLDTVSMEVDSHAVKSLKHEDSAQEGERLNMILTAGESAFLLCKAHIWKGITIHNTESL